MERAPKFTRPSSHSDTSILEQARAAHEGPSFDLGVNSPAPGSTSPRDLDDAHPLIGSSLMADVGTKPARQVRSGVGLYDKPKGDNSDGVMQSWFTKLHGVPKPSFLDYDDIEAPDQNGEEPSRELMLARFVIKYLGIAGRDPGVSVEQIQAALESGGDDRRIRKFDEALSEAGTHLHTVSSIYQGGGPKIIKKKSDTWVPGAVVERVQVLPRNLRHRRLKNRAKNLSLERTHARAEMSSTSRAVTPRKGETEQDFFDRRAATRRSKAHHRAEHHKHHVEENTDRVAMDGLKPKVYIKPSMKQLAYKPSRKLRRATRKLVKTTDSQPQNSQPQTVATTPQTGETADQRMQRMRRQAATRAGR